MVLDAAVHIGNILTALRKPAQAGDYYVVLRLAGRWCPLSLRRACFWRGTFFQRFALLLQFFAFLERFVAGLPQLDSFTALRSPRSPLREQMGARGVWVDVRQIGLRVRSVVLLLSSLIARELPLDPA